MPQIRHRESNVLYSKADVRDFDTSCSALVEETNLILQVALINIWQVTMMRNHSFFMWKGRGELKVYEGEEPESMQRVSKLFMILSINVTNVTVCLLNTVLQYSTSSSSSRWQYEKCLK